MFQGKVKDRSVISWYLSLLFSPTIFFFSLLLWLSYSTLFSGIHPILSWKSWSFQPVYSSSYLESVFIFYLWIILMIDLLNSLLSSVLHIVGFHPYFSLWILFFFCALKPFLLFPIPHPLVSPIYLSCCSSLCWEYGLYMS